KRRRNSNKKDGAAAKSAEASEEAAVAEGVDAEAPADNADTDAASDHGSDEGTDNDADENNGNGGPSMAAVIEGEVVSEDLSVLNDHSDDKHDEASEVESVGAGDALEEMHVRRRPVRRQYK